MMGQQRFLVWLTGGILLFVSLNGICKHAEAQLGGNFGKNKVHYKDFSWATLPTDHFTIYFYRGEAQLAEQTSRMAERAYQYLSKTLQHEMSEKIPLICYASSDDFQQTEIIDSFLGEGIGGVTESLRGRIIIPFLGSYRYFNHVLIHELVHAFQFDILSEGGGGGSFVISGAYIPLWFMEGMAEYFSEYQNPLTDMWLRDAVLHDTLPKAKQIESINDIRAYRFGQSLWTYLGEAHGDALAGDLLREIAKTEDWYQSIKTLTNTSWKECYAAWLERVQEKYFVEDDGAQWLETEATRLISHKKDEFSLNIIPAVSPDGKYVAFISDRDFYRTIYLASAESGELLGSLVAGERRGTFETLRYLNTSLTWSPDSRQIAFNAKAGGENAIYLMDINSRKITKTLVPALQSVSFLAWSPNRRIIALTGTQNGQEDLYLLDLDTEELAQLTNDLFTNRHPAWSPDGQTLAFITDAGQFSDLRELQFGPSNLALYDMASAQSYRLTDNTADDVTPVWSPDGSTLAFVSDRSGVYNIYALSLEEQLQAGRRYHGANVRRLTFSPTGIVGLTENNPAITWARESGTFLFSGFSDKGWDIFAYAPSAPLPSVDVRRDRPEAPVSKTSVEFGKKDWSYPLFQSPLAESKEYSARLQPDYFFGGGGGNDEGFMVLARLGFSDMLSNHRLTIGCNLTEVFDESDFLVDYRNKSRRLGYEISLFQYGDSFGTYSQEDAEFEVDVQRGLGINFSWPFDKFRRVEFGLQGWMVSGDLIEDTRERTLDDQIFISPTVAYVHDTTLYTGFGPLAGKRYRYSLTPAIGDFMSFTAIADHRWYLRAGRRSVLAVRMLTAGSFGENARIFEINGPGAFRSGDFDSETDEELRGSKLALGNLEYRFPLLPKINFLRGAIFWDMALDWTKTAQPFSTRATSFIRLQDARAAYGMGIRVPLSGPFGLLNLRFDVSRETDLNRNLGEPNFLFSIEQDF